MGLIAFVFPGQGAQSPGMGMDLYKRSPAARKVMDQAENLLPGLLDTCFKGPMDKITQTQWAQPSLYAVSLSCAAAAGEAGLKSQALAGFSLGEWTALTHAGMLDFQRAFQLVCLRGQWMADCAAECPGSMAALMRISRDEVLSLTEGYPKVHAANFNAPDQTVVAGENEAIDEFLEHLSKLGKRFIKLRVAGAFHSPLMNPVSEQLKAALSDQAWAEPKMPVYSNLTALPYTRDNAALWLAKQASSSVRWTDTIRIMATAGVDTFVELGPGKVLSGLIEKILPESRVLQVETLDGLLIAAERLREKA